MKYKISFVIFLLTLLAGAYCYAQSDLHQDQKKNYDAYLNRSKKTINKLQDQLNSERAERIQLERKITQLITSNKTNEKAVWGTSLNCYDEFINRGDILFKEQKFLDAINQFEAAKRCDDFNEKERIVTDVKTAQERSNDCLRAIEQQRIDLAKSLVTTDSALLKAQKLIDAFYFYDDKFALAFKDDLFYFIDKNGDAVIKLGRWEKAEQFDWKNFVKVKTSSYDNYLLDTLGQIYRVAYDLKSLTYETTALDLSENNLDSIPGEVFRHSQLKVLLLHINNLSVLSAEIRQLKNLTTLILGRNELTVLPAEIEGLENLIALNLTTNNLTNLPAETGQLKNLTSLLLSDNQLTSLPPEIGQLENLTALDLSRNQLKSLPAEIMKLKNLTSLLLSGNQLTSLPPEIGQLKNLTNLDLRGNLGRRHLKELPPEIGQLKNLTSLLLGYNQLTVLPTEIGQLKNLSTLDLGCNYLTVLPTEIGQLKNLKYLRLTYNPISESEKEKIHVLLPNCEIYF